MIDRLPPQSLEAEQSVLGAILIDRDAVVEDAEFLRPQDFYRQANGRIYAATEIGIQVFDPSGRLCGVMAAPPGRLEFLHFQDDRLEGWIDDTTYTRKLNTTGAKW